VTRITRAPVTPTNAQGHFVERIVSMVKLPYEHHFVPHGGNGHRGSEGSWGPRRRWDSSARPHGAAASTSSVRRGVPGGAPRQIHAPCCSNPGSGRGFRVFKESEDRKSKKRE
jgi:hypothetical protein